jgi:hypothetical protein
MISDSNHTNIQTILDDFNALHPKVYSRNGDEQHNKLLGHNYPLNPLQLEDIHLQEAHDHRHHYPIHHPTQHKYAAVKLLYNRLNTYKEMNTKEKRISSTSSCTTPSHSTHKNHPTVNQENS